MYYKLSLVAPFVVIVLLGRYFQGFINVIIYLGSVICFAFVGFEQGVALYICSVIHSMILTFIDKKSGRLSYHLNQIQNN